MKDDLIVQVLEILNDAGFIVSRRCEARGFSLAARRNEITLLAKILRNIDGISKGVADSIKRAAFYLLASPLLVGERKGALILEDDVVYHRYGIPALNTHTLYEYLIEGVDPYVYSATGGMYVNIKGEAMKEAREQKKLSLGDIASGLGLSRRSISKYEGGEMSTTISIALKLEEILDTALIEQLDVLKTELEEPSPEVLEGVMRESASDLEILILNMLEEIGLKIVTVDHAPFNAVSFTGQPSKGGGRGGSGSARILTSVSEYTDRMIERARIVSSLSHVTRTKSVFVVDGKTRYVQIENTVLIEKDELEQIRDQEEFASMMDERAKSCCKTKAEH